MQRVVKVCIPHSNKDFYDYLPLLTTPCIALSIGARVWVPFRNTLRLGIVVALGEAENSQITLKNIHAIIDDNPLLDKTILDLCLWVSEYYQAPLSEVIPLALPKNYRLGVEKDWPITEYFSLNIEANLAHQQLSKKAKKQHELIEYLNHLHPLVDKNSLINAGFSTLQINTLIDAGIIKKTEQLKTIFLTNTLIKEPLLLNDEQNDALEVMSAHLNQYQSYLLQGVTGSGKTEVYLQLVAKILALGKQVLILVPEIGLTPQLLERFTHRFKEPIATFHSHLNDTQRQLVWQSAKENKVKLIIGTRSAIFMPLPTLGLIIIDEEHDSSLKQMEGVRYSARDTALIRAFKANIPIVLGTATPSLESLHNCILKKHTLIRLTRKAMTQSPLHYQLVDLRNQNLQQGLASCVLQTIAKHLEQKNQVLVFINRRGFAPVLLCHQCGWMADCSACDSHLTLHKKKGVLICHHCGRIDSIIKHCRSCKSKELVAVGVGTQRVFEFLSEQFPNIKMLRIDKDSSGTKDRLESHLESVHKEETQLIVGTQMLAKGHHFPRLTLVVVLDSDAGLFNQDFRAVEHLGQLLTQVAGRAGRALHPGQVFIQTHVPDHPLLNLLISQGYDAFASNLLHSRQEAFLPPFHFLALIRVQARHQKAILEFLHAIKNFLLPQELKVFGPAPAPLARKANHHRMQLLIKSSSRKNLQHGLTSLRNWITINKLSTNIRWNIDVDPQDLS